MEILAFRKMDKNIDFNQNEALQRIDGNRLLTTKIYEKNLEVLKLVSVDEKLRRYQTIWLRQATRLNNSLAKSMLNYRTNERRSFGRI